MIKNFSEMGIKPKLTTYFVGDKIKMQRILNREVIIHDFKIKPSLHAKNPGDMCLHLQLEVGGVKHVLFTASKSLMHMIDQVQETDMPFKTTIEEKNDILYFT